MYKKFAVGIPGLVLLLLIIAFKASKKLQENKPALVSREQIFKNKLLVQCSPDWSVLDADSLAAAMTILPGWGNYQWNIQSTNDSARLYFQQGINMYYSFHIIEALASFKKAALFDNNNAMIYWAQALAYGPNINDFVTAIPADAYEVAQKAISLSATCSGKEKALIAAMAVRYTPDSVTDRSLLNQRYTQEMKAAYVKFQNDADVAALYADAMMLEHPWEYWKHNGIAHPWTKEIIRVLENAIRFTPDHPGANHYYIHSVEASPQPQRALASADRLSKLMPSVSHMVHMPSHIYIRSGRYKQGMTVNEMSIKGYQDYRRLFPGVENNVSLYLIHNIHMQSACAMLGAGYDYSRKSAEDCSKSFDTSFMSIPPPLGNFIQYVYMTPAFNNVRFGKWHEILSSPSIPASYVFGDILSHWAKGMAHARLNGLTAARKELAYIKANMNKPDMLVVMQPFNAPADAARVAEKMLEGIIAEQSGDLKTAMSSLKQAVQFEDALIYNEPKDWVLPVRPYLGAVMLKAGLFDSAEKIFREDLKDNPDNHWALKGLQQAVTKLKKPAGASIKKQLDESIALTGSADFPIVY